MTLNLVIIFGFVSSCKGNKSKNTQMGLYQTKKLLCSEENYYQNKKARDFPGGTVVKNPPAKAGDTGPSPGPGRSHMPRSN